MVSGILVEDIIPKKGGQCSFYLKLPKIKIFKEKIGSKFDTTKVMEGAYTGSFSSGVTISWDDGWDEKFKHSSGSTATLIDGNGFDWDYKVCDVDEAQKVLDGLK